MRTKNYLRHRRQRSGYVLVMCLLAVAISSGIVLTLFNVLRVQTAESSARRHMTIATSLNEAAVEHAIAFLLDQPNFRGTLGPFAVPTYTDRSYTLQLTDVSGDIQVNVLSTIGTTPSSASTLLKASDLNTRRAALGL